MNSHERATGLRHAVFMGMASVAFSTAAIRFLSFGQHIALGWILDKDEFAVWGIAVSVGILVAGLRNSGTGQILVQEGTSSGEKVRSIAQFSWLSSLSAAVILIALAPGAGWFFDDSRVVGVVLVMAGAVAISSPAVIHRARLSVDFRFKEVAVIDAFMTGSMFVTTVSLALTGAGAMSFAVGQVVGNVMAWALYRRKAGKLPVGAGLNKERALEIFRAARWLIAAAFATALAMSGDYLVVGRFARESLGDYFFGFQLALVSSSIFGGAIQRVMLPTFVKLNDDPDRQVRAYERSIRLVILAAAPFSLALVLVAPALVSLIWSGKWDEAIPVIQIMAVSVLFPLIGYLSEALFQSRGLWSFDALSKVATGVLIMLGAYVGTQIGGLVAIAVLASVVRLIVAPAQVMLATRGTSASPYEILTSVASRMLPFVALGIGLFALVNAIPVLDGETWMAVLLNSALVTVSTLALLRLVFPEDLKQITGLVRSAT